MTTSPHRDHVYTVGWICALPVELAAARAMLDEEYEGTQEDDSAAYAFGRIGQHKVIMAGLPAGQTGTNSAAAIAVRMTMRHSSIRVGLMVGIGGGVPSAQSDVRLGDVVISQPHLGHNGVVQYDLGKDTTEGFVRTGSLSPPPSFMLGALTMMQSHHLLHGNHLSAHLFAFNQRPLFVRESAGPDHLFKPDYQHISGGSCTECDMDKLVIRPERQKDIVIHYGTIASGNRVIKDGTVRDKMSSDLGGILCFEMEAAGLMTNFPCLVIRGICDYSDSHKNDRWQPVAAAAAAACAKEFLSFVPGSGAKDLQDPASAIGVPNQVSQELSYYVGISLLQEKKYVEAERVLQHVFLTRQRTLGMDDADTLMTLFFIGGSLASQNKPDAALRVFQEVFEGRKKVLGMEHADTLESLHFIGWMLELQEKYAEAEEAFQMAFDSRKRLLGARHSSTLSSLSVLGGSCYCQQKYEAAERAFREVFNGHKKLRGMEHADTLLALHNMGEVLFFTGQYTAAQEAFQTVYNGRKKVLGSGHDETLITQEWLDLVNPFCTIGSGRLRDWLKLKVRDLFSMTTSKT